MTAVAPRPVVTRPYPVQRAPRGAKFLQYLHTTDPKVLGVMYIATSFAWFMIGGLMALFMRAELAQPGMQFLAPEQYNQLFTMHGTIMLLFYATAVVFGFANFVLPLQIGAPDVAFPRLNAFSYWLYFFGAIISTSGFFTPNGAAAFGWTAYPPLSGVEHSPGVGGDLWIMGLAVSGLGTILGGVNMITTVICMRAPGMTMWRLPIFTWGILVTSMLILIAFPVLTAALLALASDRHFGSHVFDPANGGAILYQHLFWFFGHPEVYIIALPFFGIISEVFPVFSRKPLFGYRGMIYALLAIAALSVAVWAHHMFATGAVLLPFFSFMTFLIAIPTGLKFFNWIGTMWKGQISFETPMLFACGFLVTFLFGGLTGVILAAPALDFHVSDSYFVVAHFHYVLFGTIVFATYAGHLLLVPEDDRPVPGREAGQAALLGHLHRLPPDVPDPALAGQHRHAAPLPGLPADGRVHHVQHHLHDRCVRARRLHAAVHLERHPVLAVRRDHHRRRPVGLRQLAGVGDEFTAAAAQLHLAAADPLRAPGVRAAPPVHDRADADRGPPAPELEGAGRGRGQFAPEDPGGRGLRLVDRPVRRMTHRSLPIGRLMSSVLITVTGPDRPGVTGVLFTALAAHRVEVLDIDQAVIRGQLTLGVLVGTPEDPDGLRSDVEQAMGALGMDVRVAIDQPGDDRRRFPTHAVVVLGRPLQARAIGELALRFGELGVNIEAIKRIADYPVTGLELSVRAPDDEALRAAVVEVGAAAGVDIAVERVGISPAGEAADRLRRRLHADHRRGDRDARRPHRNPGEGRAHHRGRDARRTGLRRVAARAGGHAGGPGRRRPGRGRRVPGTHPGRPHHGPHPQAPGLPLRHRVRRFHPGHPAPGRRAGPGFRRRQHPGGGRRPAHRAGGRRDRRPGRQGQGAGAVRRRSSGSGSSQTVAVGDGANDIDMLSAAGLGIAFNAKPVVAGFADTTLNQPFLDPVLFILGISREEIEAADAADGTLRRVPLD